MILKHVVTLLKINALISLVVLISGGFYAIWQFFDITTFSKIMWTAWASFVISFTTAFITEDHLDKREKK